MRLVYFYSSTINSIGRGLLSLYLMYQMGLAVTGDVAGKIAPYIFFATFITSLSGECFIRGDMRRFSGFRLRLASILLDGSLLLVGVVLLVGAGCFNDLSVNSALPAIILIASAFGQISFNNLINKKKIRLVSIANLADIVIHLCLQFTVLNGHPTAQFVLLSFSRWVMLNTVNIVHLSINGEVRPLWRALRGLVRKSRVSRSISTVGGSHVVNLSLKAFWTTLDVFLLSTFWSDLVAGNYRFAKSLGIIPSTLFGPIWTLFRDKIVPTYHAGTLKVNTIDASRVIAKLALSLTSLLPFTLILIGASASLLENIYPLENIINRDILLALSAWWLISSCFGWIRYSMVASGVFFYGTLQSVFIVLTMLLCIPMREHINPVFTFPSIILLSNVISLYYILKTQWPR